MNVTLLNTKLASCNWVDSLIPTLPFITAISVGGHRLWHEQSTKKIVALPTEPGIYLIYPLSSDTPVYIGEASDLRRRLTYHFADSPSSNKESTLKKNLRKAGIWDRKHSIDSFFRFRCFTVSFGRTEVEEHLHVTHKVNTGKD